MFCVCPGSGAGAFVNCVASVKLPSFKILVERRTSNSARLGSAGVTHESVIELVDVAMEKLEIEAGNAHVIPPPPPEEGVVTDATTSGEGWLARLNSRIPK